jgi:hypothetical protein
MDASAYVNGVVEQTSTFAGWVHGKDAATPVPTCPKWTLADLVDHVGATQRMVAMLVGERMTDPSPGRSGTVRPLARTHGLGRRRVACTSMTFEAPDLGS